MANLNLQTPPKRTGKSDLSDNELLLFDMMFDCNASKTQLSSSVYAEHMNCDYNHSLDDTDLNQTIEKLLSRKLIQRIGNTLDSNKPRYTLSETGGELWEIERKPDWQCFVATSQKELGNFSTGSIIAWCTDEIVGRLCLGSMFSAGLITPTGSIRGRASHSKRLVPWKSFPVVYSLRCSTSDNINHWPKPVEWDAYEKSRCWWRTIAELQTLNR